ncbi:MAG: TIGR00730 family Rossman fold protein [Deferribacteraceae bacterium]|jgi:uncharacterized protein (TIGR00730 family)|nr:TIGR00730 family Rossman fold protein [Deferribacteraceae bacterium]
MIDNEQRIKIVSDEIAAGFTLMEGVNNGVTIFGSARAKKGSPYYNDARKLASLLAKDNISVITGGGPGIMEAANRGAFEVGGESIGLNIVLPYEQRSNPYLTKSFTFTYFYTRKLMLVRYSKAFIVFPGGFGTMDELFETINLINTERMPKCPIILVGKNFWQGLVSWIQTQFADNEFASEEEIQRFIIMDTPEEVAEYLIAHLNT